MLGQLHYFRILKFIPKSVRTNHNHVVIVYLETCDFRLVDNDSVLGLFGFEVSEGSGGGESSWEYSEWASNGIIKAVWHLSKSSGLIYLASGFDYSFFFIRIGRLVVVSNFEAFCALFTHQNGPRIS